MFYYQCEVGIQCTDNQKNEIPYCARNGKN